MGNRVDTKGLIDALRVCRSEGKPCTACPYRNKGCMGEAMRDAADRLEELVERCARYADEIIELRGCGEEGGDRMKNFNCGRCIHRKVCPACEATMTECGEYLEIVRCEDCRHWNESHRTCESLKGMVNHDPKGFCSKADRKVPVEPCC